MAVVLFTLNCGSSLIIPNFVEAYNGQGLVCVSLRDKQEALKAQKG
jgi:hypothetical protein